MVDLTGYYQRTAVLIGCFQRMAALIGCFQRTAALIGCFQRTAAAIGCFRQTGLCFAGNFLQQMVWNGRCNRCNSAAQMVFVVQMVFVGRLIGPQGD